MDPWLADELDPWPSAIPAAQLPPEVLRDLRGLRPPPRIAPGRVVTPVRADPKGVTGPTRDRARGPHWRRVGPNLWVPSDVDVDQPDQRIVEAAQRLPAGGAVTGWAALHWRGARWFGGTGPSGERHPVALSIGDRGRRRPIPGIRYWREAITESQVDVLRGVRVASPETAVFDEMRTRTRHSVRHAVTVLEMAMFAELTSRARFREYLATRRQRKWVDLARTAVKLAHEGPESPQESRMVLTWELDAGLPRPMCNVDLFGEDGTWLGRPDLLDLSAGVVGEYDGGHHRSAKVRSHDVSREERFRSHGLEYFTIVEGDLPRRSRVVDRMVGTRQRALRSAEAQHWTLIPPPGSRPALSLDRRLELRELLADSTGG